MRYRHLAYLVAVGIVGTALLYAPTDGPTVDPLPTAPITNGVCDWEDASPEWWADPDCTGHDPVTVPEPSPKLAPTPALAEDDPGWDCRTRGNHVCGPDSDHPAGCYRDGSLVVAWRNYDNPRLDPLWARLTAPC